MLLLRPLKQKTNMKTLSSERNKQLWLLLIVIAVVIFPHPSHGQDSKYPDYNEDVFMDWDLEKNLATPVVEKSEKKAISKYMKNIGLDLKEKKYGVALMREDEVMIVSIPSDELFLPNDTLLTKRGLSLLAPLLDYMKEPYMYKIVFTINTDDTGSRKYLDRLSVARTASVYEWFMDQIDNGKLSEDLVLIPYSMAATLPIESNDEREGRYKNRRLEIYFIPGPEMIEKASKKMLKK